MMYSRGLRKNEILDVSKKGLVKICKTVIQIHTKSFESIGSDVKRSETKLIFNKKHGFLWKCPQLFHKTKSGNMQQKSLT